MTHNTVVMTPMMMMDQPSGAPNIGKVTPAAKASMLVATAATITCRHENRSGNDGDASWLSHSIFAPMAINTSAAIPWVPVWTWLLTATPTQNPIAGMTVWAPPNINATPMMRHLRDSGEEHNDSAHAATTASIANPTANVQMVAIDDHGMG
jgi:hypothetical protein